MKLDERVQNYAAIFPVAWKNYLDEIENGTIYCPSNETEMQSQLFSECLTLMKNKNLEKPYEILIEDSGMIEGKRPDITIGLLEGGRIVAIELKHFSKTINIENDIKKLIAYSKNCALYNFFAMIGEVQFDYKGKINLENLGLERNGEFSLYEWREVDSSKLNFPIETLLIALINK